MTSHTGVERDKRGRIISIAPINGYEIIEGIDECNNQVWHVRCINKHSVRDVSAQ